MKKYLIIFTFFMYNLNLNSVNIAGLKGFTTIYISDLPILHETVQDLLNKQCDVYCLFESCYLKDIKLKMSEASEINSPFGEYVILKVDGVGRLN